MSPRIRTILYIVLWLLAIGSCLMWGFETEWVAGLSLIVVSLTTYFWSQSEAKDEREMQRNTVGAVVFLLLGLLLLYVGLAPLFKK